jgi:hypothetical protein
MSYLGRNSPVFFRVEDGRSQAQHISSILAYYHETNRMLASTLVFLGRDSRFEITWIGQAGSPAFSSLYTQIGHRQSEKQGVDLLTGTKTWLSGRSTHKNDTRGFSIETSDYWLRGAGSECLEKLGITASMNGYSYIEYLTL